MKNEGKIFETSFENSIDENKILKKRFNDNAASFGGSTNTRFSSTNECDYELFDPASRTLYFLELKTTLGSLTYWRKDFEDKKKKQSFQIKKNQIEGLNKFSKYNNTVCGFIINFRATEGNNTYFVSIDNFLNYTSSLDKKSINEKDVLLMNPIVIENRIKRVRYTYDIDDFIGKTKII